MALKGMILTVEPADEGSSSRITRCTLGSKAERDVEARLTDGRSGDSLELVPIDRSMNEGIPNDSHAIRACRRPEGHINDNQKVEGIGD